MKSYPAKVFLIFWSVRRFRQFSVFCQASAWPWNAVFDEIFGQRRRPLLCQWNRLERTIALWRLGLSCWNTDVLRYSDVEWDFFPYTIFKLLWPEVELTAGDVLPQPGIPGLWWLAVPSARDWTTFSVYVYLISICSLDRKIISKSFSHDLFP